MNVTADEHDWLSRRFGEQPAYLRAVAYRSTVV